MSMRSLLSFLAASAAVAGLALSGCGEANDAGKKQAGAGDVEKPGEHHEGDGHDDHGHPTEGPHKGHLIELGKEEYHAELTHDETSKTVTVYLLDSKAEKSVPTDAVDVTLNLVSNGKPQQVRLAAAPQAGDPAGSSSAFAITDEAVLEALESPKTTGRLNISINGKSYVGEVEHEEHDGHK